MVYSLIYVGNIISSWRLDMPNHGFHCTAALIKSLNLNISCCMVKVVGNICSSVVTVLLIILF